MDAKQALSETVKNDPAYSYIFHSIHKAAERGLYEYLETSRITSQDKKLWKILEALGYSIVLTDDGLHVSWMPF